MARPNFFNENANRSFPFVKGTVGIGTPASSLFTMKQLPDDVIADCGFIMGPESGFVEGVHSVFLYKISRVSATRVDYEFRSDAPNLYNAPLIFTLQTSDSEYLTQFVESDSPSYEPDSQSTSLSLSVSEIVVECGEPFWSGYLVATTASAVTNRLTIGTSVVRLASEATVEPALIQNQDMSQVVSLNIANGDRTRVITPSDCPDNEWAFNVQDVYVDRECIQGDIQIRAGYNLALGQTPSGVLQFQPRVNAGLGEPCEEVKLFPSESPPIGADNDLLAGGYYCNEVLKTVNGLQGPSLTIYAGTGVAVSADTATNRVVLDVNLVDLSLCTFSAISESI